MKYLSDLSVKKLRGKTCLLRLDLNVQDKTLDDSLRLERSVPTILYLLRHKCRVVILSHRGRPSPGDGKNLSLKSASQELSELIGQKITLFKSFNFKKIRETISNRPLGEVFMLENLRFQKREEANSIPFAKQLASLGNIYINDAFAVCHRKNASVTAITRFLPSFAGLEMELELKAFRSATVNARKPLVLILGGVKIADKVGVINRFYSKAAYILTGGGVANTFLAAKKMPIGKSLWDKESLAIAKKWARSKKIVIPQDVVVSDSGIYDIGPLTVKKYSRIIKKSRTIIWNGPMGYIENKKFQAGTVGVAKAIGKSKGFSIVGGGETTSLILNRNLQKNVSFLSVGGGAMLEYLSGKKLPGIEALSKK
jgi:3-phosphoglycerate kinase